MNFITLSAEHASILRDEHGVPVEWTILHTGSNKLCQEGIDGEIALSADDMSSIMEYHQKKGELIPVDSDHYLFELARSKGLEEAETLRLFPGGVAALGFGSLHLAGDELRLKVKWNPAAHEMLKEKLYKYFSPVIRGLKHGPLRVTSVAMTNTPAINNLDALAASANQPSGLSGRSDLPGTNQRSFTMTKTEKALQRLLGRDTVALSSDIQEKEDGTIAAEIEEKASVIEEVTKLLKLEPGASLDEIIAALKAEIERAADADEKQAKLDELAANAEADAHAKLVNQGRAEGKITNADMEYINSLDSRALAAHLQHCGRKVPVTSPVTPKRVQADTVALSASDRLAISALRNAGVADAEKLYLEKKGLKNG